MQKYERLPEDMREKLLSSAATGFTSYGRLIDRKNHTDKYMAGVVGEVEAKRWLVQLGYEVYSFGLIAHYFDLLKTTIDYMAMRRKQENIAMDKDYINALELKLKDVFGESFQRMRQFYFEFLPMKRAIRKTKLFADQVGGVSPDFIVRKGDEFSIVEVKANTSMPTKHQRLCFERAKVYGFKSMVLRVIVEKDVAKEVNASEYSGRV